MYARLLLLAVLFSVLSPVSAQYLFEGRAPAGYAQRVVCLDIIDEWNNFQLVAQYQQLRREPIDSAGHYRIAGDGLPGARGFYRLRFDDGPVNTEGVRMNFLDRHFVHFLAEPNDTLRFDELTSLANDPTNTAITRIVPQLDRLNEELRRATHDRPKTLVAEKRTTLLREAFAENDPALNVFLLGNWPGMSPSLADQQRLEAQLADADDLRTTYLTSLRASIGALTVADSRRTIRWLGWGMAVATALALLFAVLFWRGRRSRGSEKEQAPPLSPVQLSPKEMEVLDWIVRGKSNKAIAERLFVSEATVKSHINSIYKKADLRNRHEARVFGERWLAANRVS